MKQDSVDRLPVTFEANIEANDADEVAAYVSHRLNPASVRPVDGARGVRLKGNYGFTGSVGFWTARLELGADITPLVDFDGFFFYGPVTGALSAKMRKGTLDSVGSVAIMADGADFKSVHFAPGRIDVGLCFDRSAIVQRLSHLIDAPLRSKLVFEPLVDIAAGPAAAMVGMTACITTETFAPVLNAAPLTSERIAATMIDMALETLPHNYSGQIHQTPPLIAPRHVRRAIDYIKAHLSDPITIDDVAAVCGVSLRALQYGFQRFVGVSPRDYLRSLRLEAARRDIEANPDALIGSVAKRWGFTNAGRFNALSKEQFGESVSSLRHRLRST